MARSRFGDGLDRCMVARCQRAGGLPASENNDRPLHWNADSTFVWSADPQTQGRLSVLIPEGDANSLYAMSP
jgi:hypothetical protein